MNRQLSAGARFRALLSQGQCLVTPGCHDPLSARLAEAAGFEALAIGGFAVEAAMLGKPDLGLLTLTELVGQARRIAGSVSLPITCDGETGFGGVHNIARLVRDMEDAGIAGIQIEDQANPKRCPVLEGRTVVSLEEQLVRLGAALAARHDPDFLVIARSDADVLGVDALIERCNRYLAAGADMAMPICFNVDGRPLSALDADAQMELFARIAKAIDGPSKAALIPQGYAAADMGRIGYSVVGLTGSPIEAAVNAMHKVYASIRATGSEEAYRASHPPIYRAPDGVMRLLGIDDHLAFEQSFAAIGGRP